VIHAENGADPGCWDGIGAGGMEVGVVVCSRVETIEWASKERVYGIGMCHGIGVLDLGIMG
jgi:hypothetical protein